MLSSAVAQEIADTITSAIGHNVLITDAAGRVIGSGDPSRVDTLHEASLEVVRRRAGAWHDAAAASRLAGVKPGMTLPILLDQDVVGTVGITGDPGTVRSFGEIVRRQTEILVRQTMLLRLDLLRERALEQLVQDIAGYEPDSGDDEWLHLRAEKLGFAIVVPRAAVIIAIDHPSPRATDRAPGRAPDIERQSRTLQLARDVFDAPQDLVTEVAADTIAVLADLSARRGSDADLGEACRHLLAETERRYDTRAWAGVGPVARELAGLRRSYHDAWTALRLGRRLAPDRALHRAEQFRIRSLLTGVGARQRQRYRDGLLADLRAHRSWPELRRTIVAWVEHGLRLTDTARALRIHRNTLIYRLDRISTIAGTSIRTPRHAVAVYLACLLDELDDPAHALPPP
ncbi:MAG TPA: sugar diacid recognition domain-containing protein [Euzebyales bacterium]|nr:sugar diacid recognition domain-containing protein [Euzebyales bacterium]